MNLLSLVSKTSKVLGVLPGLPGRKKRLTVAIGGLLVALMVGWGVPPDIAEALSEVFQAALAE